VLIRAVQADETPVPVKNPEVLQYLGPGREDAPVGVLPPAVPGI